MNINFILTFGNMRSKWEIWIDTGGTFTDCIAQTPEGTIKRAKVLSNSCLRGQIIAAGENRGAYFFSKNWPNCGNIFSNYTIRLPQHPELGPRRVLSADMTSQTLQLDHPFPVQLPVDFEITAHEEAPILAIRLITDTALDQALPPIDLRLGFTKGTNALLERKGAPTALLITQGFGDLLAIGTQQRPDLFQLHIPPPQLLYQEVFEVKERLAADGQVLEAITNEEINRLVDEVKILGFSTIAIALLHSYRNPVHELALGEAFAAAGIRFISLSHALSPSIKLLTRAQTAVVNAYLAPILNDYLDGIQKILLHDNTQASLHIMTSAGGLVKQQHFFPKDSLLSGPAGGIVGATQIAKRLGFGQVLTLDMGGTSTDTARFEGRFDYRFATKINNIELQSPALAIETVAAGGGSICFFADKKLCVGPESAGAFPGPACYGAGGPLTITDVNLLLGKMHPAAMGIPIRLEAAKRALINLQQTILRSTGETYDLLEILQGLETIADEKMADAIRRISVARGFNPAEYPLLSFGGAGGLHACRIAQLLDIDTIILPFDAGLLSAYGMGKASIERMAGQQVLQLWSEAAPALDGWIEALAKKVNASLLSEGFSPAQIEIREVLLFLRFQGQDSALEIPYQSGERVLTDFRADYEKLFGYFPEGRTIELESIRVVGASIGEKIDPIPRRHAQSFPQPHQVEQTPLAAENMQIFDWEKMKPGQAIIGPAVLLQANSTAFIALDWELTIQDNQDALIRKLHLTEHTSATQTHREAVDLELFSNRFTSIAEEMGVQLQRTAFSVNVKERLDFSCALLDPGGRLLVNAPHIPVHLGSLGICARLILEKIRVDPGDVVLTNHPKYGGSHLPDVTLLSGVFTADGELIGYVINRAHHAEIGGKSPGSMPPDATSLEEEGVAFVPTYLVKDGIPQWQKIENQLQYARYPTRALAENLADLHAALASLRTGEQALLNLTQQHGLNKVQAYMQQLQQSAKEALNPILKSLAGKKLSASECLDDGHRIKVAIQVEEKKMIIDFSKTSGPHPNNLNANISIVYSVVIYVLRLLCGKSIPLNDGLMEQVTIILPDESFLHPHFTDDARDCPAVVGGNTEVSQRLTDTLLKAFALVACSQGTMNNFLFGDQSFGYYETIGGGTGAGPGFVGRSAVHQHMTNTKITDPEDLEFRYPVRLHRFAIRSNSGGEGMWNGGDGIIREVEFLRPVQVTILSQHRVEKPYGMEGGSPGKVGKQYLKLQNGQLVPLSGVDSRNLVAGDIIVIETPGGGGWG
jgi:5-oxoprolinase (ATP-hydrolysing)